MRADEIGKSVETAPGTAAPVAHKAKARPTLVVQSSETLPFWAGFRMAVLAAPGVGKTHLLFTASRHYTTWPPAAPAVFDDILLIETDSLGLAAAREAHVELPRVIDMTGYSDDEVFAVIDDLPKVIEADVAAHPETRLVGIDTASVLFEAVLACKMKTSEGPKPYLDLAAQVRKTFWALKALKCPVVFTCHIRNPSLEIDSKGGGGRARVYQEGSAVAAGLAPDELAMDMPGKPSAKAIRNHATLVAHLVRTELPAGKVERTLNFQDPKVETKKRLNLCVHDKEPAHLGELFAQIATGCGVPMPGSTL